MDGRARVQARALEPILDDRTVLCKGPNIALTVLQTQQEDCEDHFVSTGWATLPRYIVKHYSGCFSEGVLGEANIKIGGLSEADRLQWGGLVQPPGQAWAEQTTERPTERGLCYQPLGLNYNICSSRTARLLAHLEEFGLSSLHNFNIYIYKHTSYWFCFVAEL